MSGYHTEQETIDAVKFWFRKYGGYIIVAILAVVIYIVFINLKHDRIEKNTKEASNLFMESLKITDKKKQHQVISNLAENYKDTTYGSLALLTLANEDISAARYQDALDKYQKVYIEAKKWPLLQVLSLVNKSKIQVKQGKAQQALTEIENSYARFSDFSVILNQAKGDILISLKKYKEADAAYNLAISAIKAGNPDYVAALQGYIGAIELKRNFFS